MPSHVQQRLGLAFLSILLTVAVSACGATPTPTMVPPTATAVPPTATPVPPTATPVPPTATAVPAAPTKAAAPTQAPAIAGSASSADLDLVGAAFANLGKAQSFAMKISMDTPMAGLPFTGTIVMEMVQTPTQTIHMKIGDQLETIVVGQDMYLKMGPTWQKSTMALPQVQQLQSSFDYSKSIKPQDLAALSVTKVGSEKVDNVDTNVYTLIMPQGQSVKIWINPADKSIVKLVQQDTSGTVTVTFANWNNVKIDVPKP